MSAVDSADAADCATEETKNEPNDGGPAFAAVAVGPAGDVYHIPGMSLRDWFAGQCMRDTVAALIASGWSNLTEYQLKIHAEASYQAADAMLAAKAATSEQEALT